MVGDEHLVGVFHGGAVTTLSVGRLVLANPLGTGVGPRGRILSFLMHGYLKQQVYIKYASYRRTSPTGSLINSRTGEPNPHAKSVA